MSAIQEAARGELTIALDAGDDAELAMGLAQQLRAELLDLDVDSVVPRAGGAAPDGAKAGELLHAGELVVVLGLQRHALRSVVDLVRAWLGRHEGCSAELRIGRLEVKVTGGSSESQQRLLEHLVERHTPSR